MSDTFRKGALDKAWNWVREDPSNWTLSGSDGLVLTAGKGDITQASNSVPNILLQQANTDWTVETKMHCLTAPAPPAQNAGLVAYQCDDNFVKFVRTATFSFRRPGDAAAPSPGQLQLVVEENGQQKSVVNMPLDGVAMQDNVLWLRLDKQGDTYTAWYSVDGKKFEKMGTAKAVLKDVKVGVITCEGVMAMMGRGGGFGRGMQMPAAAPLKVSFSDFKITNRGK